MVSIFLFHRVNPKRERLWDPMDPVLFERCIRYIAGHFEVRQFEAMMTSGQLAPRDKVACILFDDGYKDNIEFAAPILAKYNCPASFYVVTDCIDQNKPTWTHILDYRLSHTQISARTPSFDYLPDELRGNYLQNDQERLAYVKKLKPFLKKLSHEERTAVLHSIASIFPDAELTGLMMDWDDLRQLKNAGHYIGSHSVTHDLLGTISDEHQVERELKISGERIEQKLQHFPATISYPIGSYNDTTIRIAKACGYSYGLAVKQKAYDPQVDSLFEIPRIELYNEPWIKTKLRINRSLETIKKWLPIS